MSASDKKKLRKEQRTAAMTERQKQEQKEAKQLKTYTLTFFVAMALVVAIVVGILVQAPINGLINQNTLAVTVGNHELNTVEMTYFYIDAINAYYNEMYDLYGSYTQYLLGFSTTKPLNEQIKDKETGETWADHFMNEAIESVKSVYGLYDLAVENGHEMSDEEKTKLQDSFDSMEFYAQVYGYSGTNQYLTNIYGNGATKESYEDYCTVSAIASSYYAAKSDELKDSYKDPDYREYEKDKMREYCSYSYLVYQVVVQDYVEGDKVKDENGKESYTPEQLANALTAARADVEKLLICGATDKEAFDKAIDGLHEGEMELKKECTENKDVLFDNLTEQFRDWLTSTDRKAGDTVSFDYPFPEKKEEEDKTEGDKDDESDDSTASTGAKSTESTGSTEGTDGETSEEKKDPEVTSIYVLVYQGANANEMKMVNVRHILVKFQGGTKDKDTNETTYSEAEKNAAKEAAQKLLDDWKAGENPSSESFAALAKEKSEDTGSKSNGGLYENVYPHQMVDAFNDWCFDPARKAGDTGLVETEYGYHVMFFESYADLSFRDFMIQNDMLAEDLEEWHDGITEKVVVTKIDLSRMEWDFTLN